jgi:AcrR family transcriptional regulator
LSTQSVLERSHPGRRAALKREILARALACFNEQGIEATTIEAIRVACETSVGAIYHHFGNKDGLIAELFFCALDDQAHRLSQRLSDARCPQDGVHAMVLSYVEWVVAEPELARFMYQARSFVAKGPHAQALADRNRTRNRHVLSWFTQRDDGQLLSRCPAELLPSLIVGPAESYCRAWLAGRVRTSPQNHGPALAAAAWGSIQAVAAMG